MVLARISSGAGPGTKYWLEGRLLHITNPLLPVMVTEVDYVGQGVSVWRGRGVGMWVWVIRNDKVNLTIIVQKM